MIHAYERQIIDLLTEIRDALRPKKRLRYGTNPSTINLLELCVEVLKSCQQTNLSVEELYEAIVAKGVSITSKNPVKLLYTAIWRDQHSTNPMLIKIGKRYALAYQPARLKRHAGHG